MLFVTKEVRGNYARLHLAQFVEKVCIYKNRANSLIPLRTLCGLCVLAKPLGVLSRHPCRIPKPLPLGKGLSVGLPPSPSKDACSQPHKATMQGRIMTATQSRCTMQRHKQLTLQRCKTIIAGNAKHPFSKI